MPMEAFLWMFLPVFVAGGSALLSYYVMQARMEVALAKERESLAEARAMLNSHKVTLEERVKATEEASKRQALDDFMQDIRIEERSYVREMRTGNTAKKSMVMQERLFFRNIPLSNWIEHEMLIEGGEGELSQIPRESVFTTAPTLTAGPPAMENRAAISKLLEEVRANQQEPTRANPETPETKPAIVIHATAFGAQ
jgi:hypothetical protein